MFIRGKHLLLVLALLVGTAGWSEAADEKITPRLARALAGETGPTGWTDGTLAIWVRFQDRDLTPRELAAGLATVKADMSDRTLARRGRSLANEEEKSFGSLVGPEDLPVTTTFKTQVEATGADFRRESRWLNATSWQATPEQIQSITELDCVIEVDLVARFRRQEVVPTERELEILEAGKKGEGADKASRWLHGYGGGLETAEMINVPPVHDQGLTGLGVVIGVMDTGFEFDHEAMQDVNIVATWDFINNRPEVGDRPGDPENQAQHGTEALSLIAGYRNGSLIGTAWEASFILAKTEAIDQEIPLEEDNWIAAMEWMEALGADVVSSAIGYYLWYEYSDMDGNTAPITLAADMAASRGVCVVVSMGSQNGEVGLPPMLVPADARKVITVGSVMINGEVTASSSRGPTFDGRIKPDVMAMGTGAVGVGWYGDWIYPHLFGTSYANAQVAGVVALMLQKYPELTPLQVRQALRMTASQSSWPDNDFGWGIVDAAGAVDYWGPAIRHTPLSDEETPTGPISVEANISSRSGLDEENILLTWRVNQQDWNRTAMVRTGGDDFQGEIIGVGGFSYVEYYIEAADMFGMTSMHPLTSNPPYHSFATSPDLEFPQLTHHYIMDQRLESWPPFLRGEATDNQGILAVELYYSINGSPEQGPVNLPVIGNSFELAFPLEIDQLNPGDEVTYHLDAQDVSSSQNTTTLGPFLFQIVAERERILLVDDLSNGKAQEDEFPYSGHGSGEPILTEKSFSPEVLNEWLTAAGYLVDDILSSEVRNGSFEGYHAVVVSSGTTFYPVLPQSLREELIRHTESGGKLLIEGGDISYASMVNPGYPEFAEKVLHTAEVVGEGGYQLHPTFGQESHALLNRPNILPETLDLGLPPGAINYGVSDVITADDESQLVYSTPYGEITGGILTHDNNTGPDGGQVVFLPFNISSLKPAVGQALAENIMAYLTIRESPGGASISGRILLDGGGDLSNTQVQVDPWHTAFTDSEGFFQISGLWASRLTVTVSREGYGSSSIVVDLMDDQNLVLDDITLLPIFNLDISVYPDLAIPDNYPLGIQSTIEVETPGDLNSLRIAVDIQHYSINNLTVMLTSPGGIEIVLHNRSGGTADDLAGTWPDELAVDGPGSLDSLLGENILGTWTLTVADHQYGATGRLNSWGLRIEASSPGQDPLAPSEAPFKLRILGNHPNPFNPRTNISFELDKSGPVRLAVFDLRGRLVRDLVSGHLESGPHVVVWDGLDRSGLPQSSGVYFYRLQSGAETMIDKMVLVR